MIIDDERAGINAIERVLNNFSSISVVASFTNGDEAIMAINEKAPDIVFLDIDMPGKNGFDVAKATTSERYKLVFVTAHESFALQAFETHAIDYLLKPVRPSRLEKCLEKIKESITPISPPDHDTAQKLVINDGQNTHIRLSKDISFIESIGRYQKVNFIEGNNSAHSSESIVTENTMEKIISELPIKSFYRIHRCYIVNIKEINTIIRDKRKRFVKLNNHKTMLPIARGKEKELELLLMKDTYNLVAPPLR